MTVFELANNPNLVPYRRFKKHFYYATYPNGDFFQGSGNGSPVFFKTERGLLDNISWHVSNIWSDFAGQIDGINSKEELYEEFLKIIKIVCV